MSTLAVAKREIAGTLDLLVANRSRLGEFDWEDLVPDVAHELKSAASDDVMLAEEVWTYIAREITRGFIRAKAPVLPSDTAQLVLFYEPDALLTLGDREVIAMADANAQHLERHRSVLTSNFHAQSNAYFAWVEYIDDRLPKLRARDCTLAEVEADE